MRRFLFVALLVLCSGPPAARAADPAPKDTPIDQIDWGQVPEYRIVPGDELTLDYGPKDDFNGNVTRAMLVRPDGRISVYPVGDVVAAGRTAAELQGDLRRLLAGEFRQPRVTVEVSKFAGNEVHVLGRVKRPGSIAIGSLPTLLQAISEAGGFEDDAAQGSVIVMRRVGVGSVSAARIRVDRMLRNGGDIPLGRFDIVYVPRNTIGKLDVFVDQFFNRANMIGSTALIGWELFNLDKVFQFRLAPIR